MVLSLPSRLISFPHCEPATFDLALRVRPSDASEGKPKGDRSKADFRVFFLALIRHHGSLVWRNLRYSMLVIIIIIVAVIVTPTADILNMCLFAAPMVALYAIRIGAGVVNSKRERGAGSI